MEDQQFGVWLRASQFNPARQSYVEVKGFEKDVKSRRVTINKPDSVVAAPAKCLTAKLGGNDVGKENPNILERVDCTKSSADFAATLQDIDDEIQKFSNSNSPAIMIIEGSDKSNRENKEMEQSSAIPDQIIKATVIDKDSIMEGKVTDFNSTELRELSFEMGWASKSHGKKGGPPKARVKEKTKCNGPGLIPVTIRLDQNMCMQYRPKCKGEALDLVSMECGEKEKRVKKELMVSNTSSSMGSAEAAGQPRRVQ